MTAPPPDDPDEEWVATLIAPDDYARSMNQVAMLTTRRILFIKRKELALHPFEKIDYPVKECRGISHRTRLAILPMIFGALALILILYIARSLYVYWEDLSAETQVPAIALLTVAAAGLSRIVGVRRHRLEFQMADRTLTWQSRPGDFKFGAVCVQKVADFARTQNLWRNTP